MDSSDDDRLAQALLESDGRFRALLEGVEKVSVQGYDAERRVIFWNAASEQLYGYRRAEALGRRLEELIIPPAMRPFVIEATRQWLASGKVSTPAEELILQHKNGSPVHVYSSHTMQRNSQGQAELYCVDIDLSERVQAEARRQELETQLREAQKLEALGQLASGIAHDFNHILGAVLGNVALAMEQLPPDHPAAAHLGLIRVGGERGRSLVQKILAFGRRQPLELRALRLQSLVRESLALLRAAMPAGVQLSLRLAEEPLFVHADPTQIQQVLMNLCTNAWHALDGRPGTVEVGLEAQHGGRGGPRVHLWVRDDGRGMDQDTRDHLFEPFFTTKPEGEGTGLGLAVAHGIVMTHGGEIQVDSTPGQGSCFHLYLPLLEWSAPPTEPAPLTELDGLGAGQRILYVDDDDVMRLTVQALLERQGYRVTLAGDAQQALELAARGVDLVISDVNMPGGSGLALAGELIARSPWLPVVLSTGHVTDLLRGQARQLGVRGLLQKEKTLEDLPELVRRVLG